MKAQKPAEGILKTNDWGLAMAYDVACNCHDSEHNHKVFIEAEDDGEISVVVYTTTMSPFWSVSRWRQMWQLLTKGYVKSEVALSMTQQQALNYSETLKQSIKDIKNLQAESNGNS